MSVSLSRLFLLLGLALLFSGRCPLGLSEEAGIAPDLETPDVEDQTPVKSDTSQPLEDEITEDQLANLRNTSQGHQFQAEVNRVMDIIVNSLYKSKEIFLRELISNSFDAMDKCKFYSLKQHDYLDSNPDLSIRIKLDPVARTITVRDGGTGMTENDMIVNLGTIARSGTKDFIKKIGGMSQKGELSTGDVSNQIGQFGVGLYSVFLVADRVAIASKHNDDPEQHIWEANSSSFTVSKDPRGNTLKRGTSVTLFLNEEAAEFLKEDRIIDLIKKYSEFIDFPIYLWSKLDKDRKETEPHWKHVNDVGPIWMRPQAGISEAEYRDFFNFIYYGKEKDSYADPTETIHFSAEGETNFKALLFIPDKMPRSYVDAPLKWKMKLRLYVRRVFITSDTKKFLPYYLSFVGGVTDSDDFPLNVGRESVQHSQLIKVIRKKLVRKILDRLKHNAASNKTRYDQFYGEFGNAIKFGIIDDNNNQNRLAKLIRFYSSASKDKYTSFDEYVARMKPGQPAIYFITATSINEANKSPYMERLRRKGYEVLIMLDNIDETVMQNLRTYDGKTIQNVAKEGNEVASSKSEEETMKEKTEEFKPLLSWLKDSYYKEKVASIRLSNRLLVSSCILIASEYGYSGNMDKIIRSQAYVHGKESALDSILSQPKNLEINPFHPLAKIMLRQVTEDKEDPELRTSADICFYVASLSGGYQVVDGSKLSGLMENMFLKNHGVDTTDVSSQIYREMGMGDDDKSDDVDDDEPIQKDESSSIAEEQEEPSSLHSDKSDDNDGDNKSGSEESQADGHEDEL